MSRLCPLALHMTAQPDSDYQKPIGSSLMLQRSVLSLDNSLNEMTTITQKQEPNSLAIRRLISPAVFFCNGPWLAWFNHCAIWPVSQKGTMLDSAGIKPKLLYIRDIFLDAKRRAGISKKRESGPKSWWAMGFLAMSS
jgi:hypothetical protein